MRRNDANFPVRQGDQQLARGGQWLDPFFGGSPWQSMRRMQEDMDQLFDRFFGGAAAGEPVAGRGLAQVGTMWAPRTDISSTEKEVRIEAELPGVNKDDIEVTLQDHHLILRADMKQETEAEDADRRYHRRERREGHFERVIPLPENANEDELSCEFRNGVLTIHVPKTEQAKQRGRRIEVKDVNQIPSQTAGGRQRSQAELHMTEDEEEEAEVAGSGKR